MELRQLYAHWDELGDVPTKGEKLDASFLHFEKGTPTQDVWHWFESENPRFIVGDVMQGIRVKDVERASNSGG